MLVAKEIRSKSLFILRAVLLMCFFFAVVVATTVPVVALFCTVLRLYYRWSRRHLGYDDAWATFSLFCAVFMVAGAWVRSDEPGTYVLDGLVAITLSWLRIAQGLDLSTNLLTFES